MDSKKQIQKLVKLFTTFSTHLSVFIIVNAVFWIIWLSGHPFDFYSWPVYLSASWLVILGVHCIVTYEIFSTKKNKS